VDAQRGDGNVSKIDIDKIINWIVTRKFSSCKGYTRNDLFQEGWVAALKAIKTFDPSKGKVKPMKLTSWIFLNVDLHLKWLVFESKKVYDREEILLLNAVNPLIIYYEISEYEQTEILVLLRKILSPCAIEVLDRIEELVQDQRPTRNKVVIGTRVPLSRIEEVLTEIRHGLRMLRILV